VSGPDRQDRLACIAVIVVNYGTADLAVEAVQSVLSHSHGGRCVTVHLVDNASPGEDAQRLAAAHAARGWKDGVTLWPETENHGFGRGNNVVLEALAAQETPPDAVFLLNPDARLENEAIDILATALEADRRAAAAGAGVRRPDHAPVTAAFRFPGLANEVARTANLGLLHRLWQHRRVPLPPDQPAGAVDWVSGAAVMFRFEPLQQAGFFDPGFFLYYEEVDLMRRLRATGWRILYAPQAHVIHEEGAATGQFAGQAGRQRDPAYLYQSWAHYFARAHGRAGALGIALLMWPAALVNIVHRRLRGRAPTLPKSFFADHWRYVIRPLLSGRGGP
jgi:N-acetylglucosaminyl-diphospho-decaprenol L-rhamnosyltransferase